MKENRERQLINNTIIVAIGQICTKFITFFLLPLYTALLSTEEYGVVDLFNTFVTLLIPIFFLQMSQSIFRFLIDVRDDEENKKSFISTCLSTVFIESIIFLIVYLIVSIFIKNEYKYFLATNVIFTMLSELVLQISRGIGDNKTYSEGSLISGAGAVILNVLFIAGLKWGAYGMLSASLISNFLCFIFVFVKLKIYKYFSIKKFDKEKLKTMLKYSIPLVPNQLSWWVVNASDRVIVSSILGLAVNGIYSAANKFSGICTTMFNVFNMTWSESASIHIKDKDSDEFFSNIINTTLKLFTSACVCLIALMPFVFNLFITGDAYEPAYYQIPILLIATIFNILVSLFGSIYVALKKSGEIAKTSIYSAIINILVNLILIKFIGLYAASISTLVSYLAMTIYRYIDVQKYVSIHLDKKFIFYSILFTISVLISYYIKNNIACFIILILAIIYAFVFNYKTIKQIFKGALGKIKKRQKN